MIVVGDSLCCCCIACSPDECAHKLDENHNDAGADLVALHRSYKMMENDKVRYMEESKNIIKRQTQVAYTL